MCTVAGDRVKCSLTVGVNMNVIVVCSSPLTGDLSVVCGVCGAMYLHQVCHVTFVYHMSTSVSII